MITKALYIGLLLGVESLVATSLQERLEKAIAGSDAISVERHVQEVGKEPRKEHQALLNRVVPLADEVYSMRKSQKSLYSDNSDIARVSIGSLMGSFSGYYLTLFVYEHYNTKTWTPDNFVVEGAALLGTLAGGYCLYKGLLCHEQSKLIEQAGQVKKLLKEELTEK